MQASWANDQARTVTEEELYELAGRDARASSPTSFARRIVERTGDVYLVRSPALLAIAMSLESAGIGLETAWRSPRSSAST